MSTGKRLEKERNKSELLFEEYLTAHGHKFDYEKPMIGKSAKPDYRIFFNGTPLFFDVKESRQTAEQFLVMSRGEVVFSVGGYDPYKYVEAKLDQAREQLDQYKEYPCTVVLYNLNHPLATFGSDVVLGAMLGMTTYMTGSDGQQQQFFAMPDKDRPDYRTAYMYDDDGPRETPFSAVLVIEEATVLQAEFR